MSAANHPAADAGVGPPGRRAGVGRDGQRGGGVPVWRAARAAAGDERARGPARAGAQGFSLLEVVISLAILAVSLGSLMQTQASSIDVVGRARDMTVAALLARSKLIDLEQHLLDEGFKVGTENDKGDFKEEGWPDYQWSSEVLEVEFDLLGLTAGIEALLPGGGEGEATGGGLDMGAALAALGPLMQPFLDDVGRSFRVVKLELTWPAGRYTRRARFARLVTKHDFVFIPPGGLPPPGP